MPSAQGIAVPSLDALGRATSVALDVMPALQTCVLLLPRAMKTRIMSRAKTGMTGGAHRTRSDRPALGTTTTTTEA